MLRCKQNSLTIILVLLLGIIIGVTSVNIKFILVFFLFGLIIYLYIQSINKIEFWLLCTLFALILVPSIDIGFVKIGLNDVLFLIGAVVYFQLKGKLNLNPLLISFLVYLLVMMISTLKLISFHNEWFFSSFLYVIKFVEMVFPLLLINKSNKEIDTNKIFKYTMYFSFASFLVALILFIAQVPVDDKTVWFGSEKFYRLAGIFYEANHFGHFAATISIILTLKILEKKKTKVYNQKVFLIILITSLLSMLLTFSRTALLYYVFALLIYIILFSKNKLKILITTFFIFGFALAILAYSQEKLFNIFKERYFQTFNAFFTDFNSISGGRVETWDFAWQVFKENIFLGIGYKGFLKYTSIFYHHEAAMDNNYLTVLVENGVVGFIVFIILNIIIMKSLIWQYKYNKNNDDNLSTILLIVWLASLISMFFIDTFTFWRSLGVILIFIGLYTPMNKSKVLEKQ